MQDKEYLLFGGCHYYPSGGFKDYLGKNSDISILKKFAEDQFVEWAHIVDPYSLNIIIIGKAPDYLLEYKNPGFKWRWEDVEHAR
jgi:hypothetical protein